MAKVSLDLSCPTKVGPPFWEEYPAVLIYGAGNLGKDVFRIKIDLIQEKTIINVLLSIVKSLN